jgi:hypothetical protein
MWCGESKGVMCMNSPRIRAERHRTNNQYAVIRSRRVSKWNRPLPTLFMIRSHQIENNEKRLSFPQHLTIAHDTEMQRDKIKNCSIHRFAGNAQQSTESNSGLSANSNGFPLRCASTAGKQRKRKHGNYVGISQMSLCLFVVIPLFSPPWPSPPCFSGFTLFSFSFRSWTHGLPAVKQHNTRPNFTTASDRNARRWWRTVNVNLQPVSTEHE